MQVVSEIRKTVFRAHVDMTFWDGWHYSDFLLLRVHVRLSGLFVLDDAHANQNIWKWQPLFCFW
ncbi:hypothetical protein ASF66_21690 [Pseudomonas sp. Leaf129]|nr:hypothetical protein ASF66_21690 [Pseudomonas sp. Leaf129]